MRMRVIVFLTTIQYIYQNIVFRDQAGPTPLLGVTPMRVESRRYLKTLTVWEMLDSWLPGPHVFVKFYTLAAGPRRLASLNVHHQFVKELLWEEVDLAAVPRRVAPRKREPRASARGRGQGRGRSRRGRGGGRAPSRPGGPSLSIEDGDTGEEAGPSSGPEGGGDDPRGDGAPEDAIRREKRDSPPHRCASGPGS